MNRTDIADQVRTTLGDHVEDFDVDAIVSDLLANGPMDSIDDFESQSYWAIVETHDAKLHPKGA